MNRGLLEKELRQHGFTEIVVTVAFMANNIRSYFGDGESLDDLLEQLWATSVKQDIETALGHHMQARESAEAREGVAAFLEKRPPKFTGR